jgi:hypothetical protein
MKLRAGRVLRRVGVVAVVFAALLGVLWFALPAARRPADGPADPLLFLRRPVVRTAYDIGWIARNRLLDDWLPSRSSAESWEGRHASFEAAPSGTRDAWESEPVYRGALWRVGVRVQVTYETKGRDDDPVAHLSIWQELDGRRETIASGEPSSHDEATGTRRAEVSGFVEDDADAFGWSYRTASGTAGEIRSWRRPR